MEDQIDTLDEGSDFLSSDEIGLDKLAGRIDVLLFPTEKIVGAYDLVARFDEIIDQPGPHETRPTSHEYFLGFQTCLSSFKPKYLFKFMLFVLFAKGVGDKTHSRGFSRRPIHPHMS